MAIIDIDGIIDNIHGVEDTLSRFADRFFKALQVLVDGEAPDPNADNADYVFTIPIEFYAQCYTYFQAYQATNDYNSYDNGYQPVLFGFDLSLDNGILSIDNFQCLGKLYTGSGYSNMWRNLSDAQKSDLVEQVKNYFTGNLEITTDYSTEPDVFTYSNGGMFNFRTRDHSDSLHFEYNSLDGVKRSTRLQVSMISESYTPRLDTDTDLISPTYNSFSKPQNGVVYCQKRPFQMITRDESWAINWVTTNDAEHNYVDTHTTAQGTFKVYYGDNYLIYYIPQNVPLSYNVIKNATVTASNKINSDNPSAKPIVIKTYEENKYGPIPPDPDKDDIDDQVMGAGANLGSIARLWLLTRQQLQDLHAAFTSAPANYDPLSSFIGVLGFGVQPIKVVGDSLPWTLNPINIRMSNGEVWHTGVEGHIVDSQVSAFSFPDIHIKKRYNNFLDYSPYATHEIFIPMCGWLTLPDIAVDRTISVTYLPDLESMRCRAVVSVVDDEGDKCVIGVKDGIMGAEVPFSNLNHSVWLANLITNAADVAGEIVTGAIGAGFTKTNAKGGTYRPYEGFTIGMAGTLPGAVGNALLSGNVNRTHVVGSNGNRTGFSDGECVMIKSTYHKIDKPDNYDHTIGKVCNKTGQLTEFNGFTVCDNPHITFSALEAEKEEIKRLLEEGVILPSGE